MRRYPALDLRGQATDLILAAIDDFSPTAVEERDDAVRAFFSSSTERDAAHAALAPLLTAVPVDVADEDWARRSQASLPPITIGRVTISPTRVATQSAISNLQSAIDVVIAPSMGFGTGHHATTRMCVEALQSIDLAGARVLDVGTGSGILAIVAAALGASGALGIDPDEDAICAAHDNLTHNPRVTGVSFEVADAASMAPVAARTVGWPVDVVAANLTGALHVRSVEHLLRAARPGGVLILSGLQVEEREAVVTAFATPVVREWRADEWVCLLVKKS